MHNNAHELNLDAAYREISSREAQGEDMSKAFVNQKTYAIEFRPLANPALVAMDEAIANADAHLNNVGLPPYRVLKSNLEEIDNSNASADGYRSIDAVMRFQRLAKAALRID